MLRWHLIESVLKTSSSLNKGNLLVMITKKRYVCEWSVIFSILLGSLHSRFFMLRKINLIKKEKNICVKWFQQLRYWIQITSICCLNPLKYCWSWVFKKKSDSFCFNSTQINTSQSLVYSKFLTKTLISVWLSLNSVIFLIKVLCYSKNLYFQLQSNSLSFVFALSIFLYTLF